MFFSPGMLSSTCPNRPLPSLLDDPRAARYGPLVWQEYLNRPSYAADLPVQQFVEGSCLLGKKATQQQQQQYYRVLVDGRAYGSTKLRVPSGSTLEETLEEMFGRRNRDVSWSVYETDDGEQVVDVSTPEDSRSGRREQEVRGEYVGAPSHRKKDKKDKKERKKAKKNKKEKRNNAAPPAEALAPTPAPAAPVSTNLVDATLDNGMALPNMRVGGGRASGSSRVMLQVGDKHTWVGEHHDDCDTACPQRRELRLVPCGTRERQLEAAGCCGCHCGCAPLRKRSELRLVPAGTREDALLALAASAVAKLGQAPAHFEVRRSSRELDLSPVVPSEAFALPLPIGRPPTCHPGLMRLPASAKYVEPDCPSKRDACKGRLSPAGTREAALLQLCEQRPPRVVPESRLVPAGTREEWLATRQSRTDEGRNCCCRSEIGTTYDDIPELEPYKPKSIGTKYDDIPELEPYNPKKPVGAKYDDIPELEPYRPKTVGTKYDDIPELEPYHPTNSVYADFDLPKRKSVSANYSDIPELEPYWPSKAVGSNKPDMPELEPYTPKAKVAARFDDLPDLEPLGSNRQRGVGSEARSTAPRNPAYQRNWYY